LGTLEDNVVTNRKYVGLSVGELGDGGPVAQGKKEGCVDFYYNLRFEGEKVQGRKCRK
jgi:hypothetical protein